MSMLMGAHLPLRCSRSRALCAPCLPPRTQAPARPDSSAVIGARSPGQQERPLPNLIADRAAPIDLAVVVLLGDADNQILQAVAASRPRFRDFHHEDAVLDRHLGALSLA